MCWGPLRAAPIKSGGTLAQIHEARNELVDSLYGGMLTVMKVQGAVTRVLFIASRDPLAWLGISLVDPAMFDIHLVGRGTSARQPALIRW